MQFSPGLFHALGEGLGRAILDDREAIPYSLFLFLRSGPQRASTPEEEQADNAEHEHEKRLGEERQRRNWFSLGNGGQRSDKDTLGLIVEPHLEGHLVAIEAPR